jgi:hypothetical protein
MKKIYAFLLSLLLLTGCSTIDLYTNQNNVDNIVKDVFSKNINLYNNVFDGYKFYTPRGLKVIDKNKYNCKILTNDETLYLYVDVVSYYYKRTKPHYNKDNMILSKDLSYNGKNGYIQISEINNKYYIEYLFNYSKIEAYINKNNLNETILNMTYILSSINYNDKVIETLIHEDTLDYKEEKFDLFESKTENSNFLQALEKYDNYVETNPEDQDILEFEEVE